LVDDEPRGKKQSATNKSEKMDHFTAISLIQESGYPELFILNSIELEQLNHATAFYKLVTSQFEY